MEKDICKCNFIHKDVIEKVEEERLGEEELNETSKFLKVLGDKTRFTILSALFHEEMCVCDIAYMLDKTHSSVSHQLKVLRENRLVKRRKDGKVAYYSLADNHIKNIIKEVVDHVNHEGCEED